MKHGYSAAAVRAAEAPLLDAGHGAALMRTAAAGLARVCRRLLIEAHGQVTGTRVMVLAGAGSNGGDALFAGANLAVRGAAVTVIDVFGRLHPEGRDALVSAGGTLEDLGPDSAGLTARADLVIDGILGTGAKSGLPENLAAFIADWQTVSSPDPHRTGLARTGLARTGLARTGRGAGPGPLVVAVDVPTGIDATTGDCSDVHVRADHTVTFGGHKAGILLPGGADAAGEITLIDIGLDFAGTIPAVDAPEPADLHALWPYPSPDMQKYTRGVLGLVAGSRRFPGAGLLVTAAAVSTGVGMLRLIGPPEVESLVLGRYPEVVTGAGRVQAWTLGSGAPDALHMRRALIEAENSSVPIVIDAGGLSLITRPLETSCVVTPHAGELVDLLSRLTTGVPDRSEVEARPVVHAVRAAQALEGIVVLKGNRTVIARPDGTVVAPQPGPPALATAGTGDVLAGILGALLATTAGDLARPHSEGIDVALLAGLAVTVHNLAGARITHSGDLPAAVQEIVLGLTPPGEVTPGAVPPREGQR